MTAAPKAKKTPRNQPIKFDETLAMNLPEQPTLPHSAPMPEVSTLAGLTPRQIKTILWIVWMLAAIFAGIGVGRLMLASRPAADVAVAPAPIATTNLKVSTSKSAEITPAHAIPQPSLKIVNPHAITQAQAGTPSSTLALAALQSAASSDAQQPGFDRLSRIQGNAGVPAIR